MCVFYRCGALQQLPYVEPGEYLCGFGGRDPFRLYENGEPTAGFTYEKAGRRGELCGRIPDLVPGLSGGACGWNGPSDRRGRRRRAAGVPAGADEWNGAGCLSGALVYPGGTAGFPDGFGRPLHFYFQTEKEHKERIESGESHILAKNLYYNFQEVCVR